MTHDFKIIVMFISKKVKRFLLDDYLKNLDQTILRFQLQLNDDSIHSKWHQIFLIQLYNMVNPPIEKDKKTELELSAKSERMARACSKSRNPPGPYLILGSR